MKTGGVPSLTVANVADVVITFFCLGNDSWGVLLGCGERLDAQMKTNGVPSLAAASVADVVKLNRSNAASVCLLPTAWPCSCKQQVAGICMAFMCMAFMCTSAWQVRAHHRRSALLYCLCIQQDKFVMLLCQWAVTDAASLLDCPMFGNCCCFALQPVAVAPT
jgi:hypothetical protein